MFTSDRWIYLENLSFNENTKYNIEHKWNCKSGYIEYYFELLT